MKLTILRLLSSETYMFKCLLKVPIAYVYSKTHHLVVIAVFCCSSLFFSWLITCLTSPILHPHQRILNLNLHTLNKLSVTYFRQIWSIFNPGGLDSRDQSRSRSRLSFVSRPVFKTCRDRLLKNLCRDFLNRDFLVEIKMCRDFYRDRRD